MRERTPGWAIFSLRRRPPHDFTVHDAGIGFRFAMSEFAGSWDVAMSERELVYEDFADKVGETFTIVEAGFPAVPLTLTEAELLKARHLPPNGRPPFSLIFVADTPQMLEQRLYCLAQEKMGPNTIFLVPIGRDQRGFLYQALFN